MRLLTTKAERDGLRAKRMSASIETNTADDVEACLAVLREVVDSDAALQRAVTGARSGAFVDAVDRAEVAIEAARALLASEGSR